VAIVIRQRHLERAGLPGTRLIPDKATLIKEIAAGERRCKTLQARISWMSPSRAREKLGRVSPPVARGAVQAA
jgi:hypothetical protein